MAREWLVDIRLSFPFTQEYTAKKTKISRAFYTQIETGERRPSPEVAKRIAIILGFQEHGIDWTRFFEDEKIVTKVI